MRNVTVRKSDLVEIVTRNRRDHRKQFEREFNGYRLECMAVLEANLESLRKNENHIVRFSELPPEDHTDDYVRVCEMLAMSVDDTIQLTELEFAQYVQDNWSWKDNWVTSNSKYYSPK